MPARKPIDLHAPDGHRARRERRKQAELSTTPEGKLPMYPPGSIRDDARAAREWRKVIRLYNKLDAAILNKLDLSMLTRYCQLSSRMDDVLDLRAETRAQLENLLKAYADQDIPIVDKLTLLKPIRSLEIALIKEDQNLNAIGRLLLQFAQSLYLLPRSRGQVNLPAKEEEPGEFPIPIGGYDMKHFLDTGDWEVEHE